MTITSQGDETLKDLLALSGECRARAGSGAPAADRYAHEVREVERLHSQAFQLALDAQVNPPARPRLNAPSHVHTALVAMAEWALNAAHALRDAIWAAQDRARARVMDAVSSDESVECERLLAELAVLRRPVGSFREDSDAWHVSRVCGAFRERITEVETALCTTGENATHFSPGGCVEGSTLDGECPKQLTGPRPAVIDPDPPALAPEATASGAKRCPSFAGILDRLLNVVEDYGQIRGLVAQFADGHGLDTEDFEAFCESLEVLHDATAEAFDKASPWWVSADPPVTDPSAAGSLDVVARTVARLLAWLQPPADGSALPFRERCRLAIAETTDLSTTALVTALRREARVLELHPPAVPIPGGQRFGDLIDAACVAAESRRPVKRGRTPSEMTAAAIDRAKQLRAEGADWETVKEVIGHQLGFKYAKGSLQRMLRRQRRKRTD